MIEIQILLERLQERGFSVHLGDGRVQIRGENIPDEETKALIHELREHREEVKTLLAGKPLTGDTQGVTAADVLRVFGGGQVIEENKPLSCRHCNEKKDVLYRSGWRKGGKIIRRIRADGFHVWACHFCGREAKRSRGSVHTIH